MSDKAAYCRPSDVTAEEMEEVTLRLDLDPCVNAEFSLLFLEQLAAHWRLRTHANVWSLRDEVFGGSR